VRDNAEAPKPRHVFDDGRRLAAQRVGRRAHPERDVMAPIRADLDAVDAENAGQVLRRIGGRCPVGMVGQDEELQTRARRGGRNGRLVRRSVGA
jgi:hypothetical protein